MSRTLTTTSSIALAALAMSLAVSAPAIAGQFTVASCQADQLNFSTSAYGDFATRGMKIIRACNPEGPGLRGLVTANVVKAGSVPRGAVSLATISAPEGTTFTTFRWAGSARRRDCRYALQLYAQVPGGKAISIKNVRAGADCPSAARAQAAGYRSRTFNVTGATSIVQRVICAGTPGHNACSARGQNYIRTYQAQVGVADTQPPAAAVTPDTPLATGAWVSGAQPLDYTAQDNVGVLSAAALVAGQTGGSDQRACQLATPAGAFADPTPCPNGPGHINIDTRRLPEGSQQLIVQAQDAAGNLGASPAVTARIDNTPPARVAVAVGGGDQWRNQNSFTASWTNAAEVDRAPIVAAMSKLCPAAGGGSCSQAEQDATGIASLPIQVPAPGQWTLSLWLRDGAGNQDPNAASVPVTLRYDPDPPQLGFEQAPAADPTLVSVHATDTVSGVAAGSIEISPAGSGTWQTLATQQSGSDLVTRVDDAALPAGNYVLRATATDQAGNEATTTQRLDGQPMTLKLPLRTVSAMKVGVPRDKVIKIVTVRNGKRHTIHKHVSVLSTNTEVAFGSHVQITGRLTSPDGSGIAGVDVQVFSHTDSTPEALVTDVHTDTAGNYGYTATAGPSQVLRVAYAGSPTTLPSQSQVSLKVPATSSLTVDHSHVLNGRSVTFSGHVRTLPIPAGGKLIELQVLLSGKWQTFRTGRTDPAGHWSEPYRFARTRGVQRYRFRVELPHEAGYPFADGVSRPLDVQVRGV